MSTTLWWMAYCVAVSAVLAIGAHALEAGARAAGRGGRHAWLVALLASVLIPIASYFRPVIVEAAADVPLDITVMTAAPGDAVTALPSALPFHPGILLWATASLLVLAFIAHAYGRLARARRGWTASSIDGVDVLLSENTGPAALGVLHSVIVLPRWVLSLEARARGLMLLHEREHVRAWDPRVTLAGVLLVALMPWNVCMWLMLRRLRHAIELDCDARVLTRSPDPARYGAVLLEVGRRRSAGGFALSTLVEPRSQLERRIRLMAEWPGTRKTTRALALAGIAVLLTGGAYAANSPLHSPNAIVITHATPADRSAADDGAAAADDGAAAADDGATASDANAAADTTRPRLLNRDEVAAAFRNQTGVNGSGVMSIFVDRTGRARLEAPKAGAPVDRAMADAQKKLADVMRFSPAVVDGEKVGTWVTFNVTFSDGRLGLAEARMTVGAVPGDAPPPPPSIDAPADVPAPPMPPRAPTAKAPATAPLAPPPPVPDRYEKVAPPSPQPTTALPTPTPPKRPTDAVPPKVDYMFAVMASDTPPPRKKVPPSPKPPEQLEVGPVFTPYSLAPALTNRVEVAEAVSNAYPPMMRDAGIGGTAIMYFLIDSTGVVTKYQVHKSSGYQVLDKAAMTVAKVPKFRPAELNGRRLAVWAMVPIVFSPPK